MSIVNDPSLVWLIGPSGAGKSTWAEHHFRDVEIVSSDRLRSIVGSGPNDLEASAPAFDVLERIAAARLSAGLLTVIDTLGFDEALRNRLGASADAVGIPKVAVVFRTDADVCRERNRKRDRSVPARVLNDQFKRFETAVTGLADTDWQIMEAGDIEIVSEHVAAGQAPEPIAQARDWNHTNLEFHLHISTFDWMDSSLALTRLLRAAETAGFAGVSLMDHLIQIPQVGRAWDDILDPFTALAHAAATTDHLRLGALVANVTLRPVAVLAKTIATLDHLSGGRMDCGLGAGWYAAEQTARGIAFPSDRERLDLVEETIGALRRFWGPGGKPFEGRRLHIADSGLYPRPTQEQIPIILGGGGERRTLRIVAEHADGCNLRTGPELDRKLEVLEAHCTDVGRDFDDLLVTVLDVTLAGSDRDHVATLVERHRGNVGARDFRLRTSAGTVDEHVLRYRALREKGVDRIYVSLIDLGGVEQVERFGSVIAAV